MVLLRAITWVIALAGFSACGQGSEVLCDCALGGTNVTVPNGLAVVAITVSGACEPADLTCADGSDAATCVIGRYFLVSRQEGTCRLEVELDGGGRFARDLRFERSDGCCSGYYPVEGDQVVTVSAP